MLSMLSVFMSPGEAWETSNGHHEALQEMLKNIAVGLEVAESIASGVEVTRIRAVDRWRRDLHDLT
jgi:hypothetical protein